jgi:hypothetical protein
VRKERKKERRAMPKRKRKNDVMVQWNKRVLKLNKSSVTEEAFNKAIQAWINVQNESSLKEATLNTVKKVLLAQFSVDSFTREQKDFIKSATITALVKRTKEIDEASHLRPSEEDVANAQRKTDHGNISRSARKKKKQKTRSNRTGGQEHQREKDPNYVPPRSQRDKRKQEKKISNEEPIDLISESEEEEGSSGSSSSSSSSSSATAGSKRGRSFSSSSSSSSSSTSSSSSRRSKRQKNELTEEEDIRLYTQFIAGLRPSEREEEEEKHPGQWLFEEGMAYWIGSDFKKEDKEHGQMMIEASASSGFPLAVAFCHYLGWNHLSIMGWNGLKRDFKKAFDMYLVIEKETNGDHWAQYMLGWCYDDGKGTDQDHIKEVEFYTKSAEQGNSLAMNNVGTSYYNGDGCDQNFTKAFEWYEKSAKLGNSTAMYNVGIYYEGGTGVTKDLIKAKEWYAKAVAQGHEGAQVGLDELDKLNE